MLGVRRWSWWQIGKNGRTLFDRPKPTVGSSANGRRGGRRRRRRRGRRRRRRRRIHSVYSLELTESSQTLFNVTKFKVPFRKQYESSEFVTVVNKNIVLLCVCE